MKTKRTLFLLIAVLALTSIQTSCAQKNVMSKKFNVSDFTSIETDIVGNIFFTQSNRTSVSAEGDKELVDNLTVTVVNNELKLSKKKNINRLFKNRKSQKLTVYVSSPQIRELEMDGVGNVTMKGKVEEPQLEISSEGVGNFVANNLQCQKIKVTSDGVGNVTLAGKTKEIKIDSDGVGNVHAEKMHAEDAYVTSDGVGNVTVFSTQSINARVSGVGNITYYGAPKFKITEKNGIGSVKAGK